MLFKSPRSLREYQRALRAGLSKDCAEACARYEQRLVDTGRRLVYVPRWRAIPRGVTGARL